MFRKFLFLYKKNIIKLIVLFLIDITDISFFFNQIAEKKKKEQRALKEFYI